MRALLLAVSTFSLAPVPARWLPETDRRTAGVALRWLPLLGAALGAVAGAATLVFWRGHTAGSPVLGATVAVVTTAFLTRGLHLDGLADTADGFGGGSTPERRLEIMKDSRIGSYGGAALVLAYVLRVACLTELLARIGTLGAAAAVVLVAALSRSAGLLLMTLLPPARMTGSSYAAGQPERGAVALAFGVCAAFGLSAVLGSPLPFAGIVLAFLLAGGVALAMTRLSKRLIGGQSGDVGGAIQPPRSRPISAS